MRSISLLTCLCALTTLLCGQTLSGTLARGQTHSDTQPHLISNSRRAGILSVEEGRFVNGKWQPGRRMNGDQDHQGRHLRIPEGEYSIQRIKLYTYK
jgi:hypothetical protein